MRVLSVDIGWRHLAYAKMELCSSTMHLLEWDVINLLEGDAAANVNSLTLEELVRRTVPSVWSTIKAWAKWPSGDQQRPDVAYLECQPLGQMARNVKTKTLSHIMQALLLAEGIPVAFVSPRKKLLGMATTGSYADNKKFAIASCMRVLRDHSLHEWAARFDDLGGKRDDLADALLQGYYAGSEALAAAAKPSRRVTAAPSKKRLKRDAFAQAAAAAQIDLDVQ
jgi:hypothetical protein